MAKSVTMRDIAAQMGVSVVTVSKALTDREGVSDEVRQKIKKKAQEMGYRYQPTAKAMQEGQNGTIGVLIAEHFFEDDSFYNKLYKNLTLELNKNGFFSVLEIVSDSQEREGKLPDMLENKRVDGLVVMGQIKTKCLMQIQKTGVPCVLLDFYDETVGIDCIISDGVYGSYCLTEYLIRQGHKDIKFVGNIHATSSILDRYVGYYKSMIQHELPCGLDCIISDRDEMGRFIEYELPERLPTAFVCNCDQVAYLLVQKLQDKGVRIPEEVSVVGFDDYIYATLVKPELTTFAVDMEGMAREAVKTISGKLKGKPDRGRRVISGSLIIRESVYKI